MDTEIIKIFGQVAGIGGLALGVFLFVCRELVRKAIFPALTKQQPSKIILCIAFMAWTTALAGIGAWTYVSVHPAKNSIGENAHNNSNINELPGDTGWIFAGHFNIERQNFIEGPYVSVENTTTRGMMKFVQVGDTIELKVSRKLIIVAFKKTGTTQKFVSPIAVGGISNDDETGVVLPKGTRLVVRDVSEGKYPGNPNAALWLRIILEPR